MALVVEGRGGGSKGNWISILEMGIKVYLGEVFNARSVEVVGMECWWGVGTKVHWTTSAGSRIIGGGVGMGLGVALGRKDSGKLSKGLGGTKIMGGNLRVNCLAVEGRLG